MPVTLDHAAINKIIDDIKARNRNQQSPADYDINRHLQIFRTAYNLDDIQP